MTAINKYFDHVYCLSLPESKERQEMTLSRAHKFGLSFSFYPAISGKLFGDIFSGYKDSRETSITNPNYMACALSHLSIYRDALANGHKRILIIEDDLLFHKSMNENFSSFIDEVPDDWWLLYLAWIPLTDDLMYWDYSIIDNNFISPNVFKAKNLWSAMSYGINEQCMNWMINRYNESFNKEIDKIFVEEIQTNYPSYGLAPQLFSGYDNLSNNSGNFDSIFFKSFDARRAKPNEYI
jgi:GR25 family glycosyltransferase involved in LPS biosynthesis